jgi:hypothetical protein
MLNGIYNSLNLKTRRLKTPLIKTGFYMAGYSLLPAFYWDLFCPNLAGDAKAVGIRIEAQGKRLKNPHFLYLSPFAFTLLP